MILTKDLLAEELLSTFTVIKVRHEPLSESEWTLQFEDYPPITYFEKCFDTIDEDENLIGKKIKAQIDLSANYDKIKLITSQDEQKKTICYNAKNGYFVATGIYFEDAKETEPKYGDISLDACIDSIFRLKVFENLGDNEYNFKKGDCVKIETIECYVLFARDYMPLKEENSTKI